ncbi:MAG TPA: DUF3152 domain-containing protein [Jiangellales bacterium]|nr:DUF3152 domain-containing protein [Jiangellales bacterium]
MRRSRLRRVVRFGALAVTVAAVVVAPGPAVGEPRGEEEVALAARVERVARALPPPGRPAPPAAESADVSPAPTTPPVRQGPPAVPQSASGELVEVGRDRPATVADGREVRYRVEVERGLPVPTAGFAVLVHQVLGDARGWQPLDGVRFVQVAGAEADLTVTLASPDTTDKLCAPLRTHGEVSCWNGSRAVLNARRWVHGAATYGEDLGGYRTYLVSHEVGHGLGHGHVGCPEEGQPAPVMVQQTKSLGGCATNPWPAGS